MIITEKGKIDNMKDIEQVTRFQAKFNEQVQNTINGNLTFTDNITGKFIQVNFKAANTDTQVEHDFGRTIVGYIPVRLSTNMVVYDGSPQNNINRVNLKSSAIGTITLFVF